jgi:hypothetical protein
MLELIRKFGRIAGLVAEPKLTLSAAKTSLRFINGDCIRDLLVYYFLLFTLACVSCALVYGSMFACPSPTPGRGRRR